MHLNNIMRLNKTALVLGLIASFSAAAALAEPPLQPGDTLQSLSQVKISTSVNGQPGSLADFVSPDILAQLLANPTQANPAYSHNGHDANTVSVVPAENSLEANQATTANASAVPSDASGSTDTNTLTVAPAVVANGAASNVMQQDLSSAQTPVLTPSIETDSSVNAAVAPNATGLDATRPNDSTSTVANRDNVQRAVANGTVDREQLSTAQAENLAPVTEQINPNQVANVAANASATAATDTVVTQQAAELPMVAPEAPQITEPTPAAMPTSDGLTSPDAAAPSAQ